MKLRNKKTGEIVSLSLYGIQINSRTAKQPIYRSIRELNEDWEDYEDECYGITHFGQVRKIDKESVTIESMQEIGNYFGTKEEAEKAIEKLKAWKRVKDKGVSFKLNRIATTGYPIIEVKVSNPGVTFDEAEKAFKDLILLFGGDDGE